MLLNKIWNEMFWQIQPKFLIQTFIKVGNAEIMVEESCILKVINLATVEFSESLEWKKEIFFELWKMKN